MPNKTHSEYVQAVREGRDYFAPRLAINDTIDSLVQCALVVQHDERAAMSPETRALDAIGVQIARELKNRSDMIRALADRLTVVEAERNEAIRQMHAAEQKLVEASLSSEDVRALTPV